jgi:hypothetical protein
VKDPEQERIGNKKRTPQRPMFPFQTILFDRWSDAYNPSRTYPIQPHPAREMIPVETHLQGYDTTSHFLATLLNPYQGEEHKGCCSGMLNLKI